jgi:hypothetical protein
MNDRLLVVNGCPCCDVWKMEKFDSIKHDLIYFSTKFMIIKWHGNPVVISREHVIELPKETWGYVLKKVRELYGSQARILWDNPRDKYSNRLPDDHWCGRISIPRKFY